MTQLIFNYLNYKLFIQDWIRSQKKKTGWVTKLANFLKVHTSYLSQILKGNKNLSLEQALKLAEFIELSELERDYFLALVAKEKSGSSDLKKYYEEKIIKLKKEANQIKSNLKKTTELSESIKYIFYSDPIYSQVKLLSSLKNISKPSDFSEATNTALPKILKVLSFLVETGLCSEDHLGNITMNVRHTHLNAENPLILTHHRNWRNKVIEFYPQMDECDLVFTAPLTISREDFNEVKADLLNIIKKISNKVQRSQSEDFVIFNLDWVRQKLKK